MEDNIEIFKNQIKKYYGSFYSMKLTESGLYPHQEIAINYLLENRSLALFFEPGAGKTRIPILLQKKLENYDMLVFLPASLRTNFEREVKKLGLDSSKINYISSNSDKLIESFNNTLKMYKEKNIRNVIFVFDEAHEISRRFANKLKNFYNGTPKEKEYAKDLVECYNNIVSLNDNKQFDDTKIIMMTGTPILNEVFEIVPMINILYGIKKDISKAKHIALPSDPEEFYELCCKLKKDVPYLTDIGYNGIAGRLYGKIMTYRLPPKKNKGTPSIRKYIIVKCRMSDNQFNGYFTALQEEEKQLYTSNTKMFKALTRMASNYVFPERLLVQEKFKTDDSKKNIKDLLVNKLTKEDLALDNIKNYSIKFKSIYDRIERYNNDVHAIYSYFTIGEGIAVFAKMLEYLGWENINKSNLKEEALIKYRLSSENKSFMVLTGSVSKKEVDNLLKIFNREENKNGKIVNVVLYSQAVNQGIDLKSVKHCHIMEPAWNELEIQQAIARTVRINSHEFIPDSGGVYVYRYISIPPETSDLSTTDHEIFELSRRKYYSVKPILKLFEETSIACNLRKSEEIKVIKESVKINTKPIIPSGSTCNCFKKVLKNIITNSYRVMIEDPDVKSYDQSDGSIIIKEDKIYIKEGDHYLLYSPKDYQYIKVDTFQ